MSIFCIFMIYLVFDPEDNLIYESENFFSAMRHLQHQDTGARLIRGDRTILAYACRKENFTMRKSIPDRVRERARVHMVRQRHRLMTNNEEL